jgi:hypothetical protein
MKYKGPNQIEKKIENNGKSSLSKLEFRCRPTEQWNWEEPKRSWTDQELPRIHMSSPQTQSYRIHDGDDGCQPPEVPTRILVELSHVLLTHIFYDSPYILSKVVIKKKSYSLNTPMLFSVTKDKPLDLSPLIECVRNVCSALRIYTHFTPRTILIIKLTLTDVSCEMPFYTVTWWVTIDGIWIGVSIYWAFIRRNCQIITAPSLISTVYRSLEHTV